MKAEDYLEKADNGEWVTLNDIFRSGDYDGMLEMFDNAEVGRGVLKVDEDYALDAMYEDDILGDVEDMVNSALRTFRHNQYEIGHEKADHKMNEIERRYDENTARDLNVKKADHADKLVKLSEAGLALGTAGTVAGAAAGEPNIWGPSAAITTLLAARQNPRWQGSRDRTQAEAAKGLNKAYGRFKVEID